jgi:multidrug efflux system membrane fusion protein
MAVPVVSTTVRTRDVPVKIEGIGNVEAYSSVSVKPQISGQLTEVRFHEGDMVRQNDVLFVVDQRPFQAALEQAQANDVRNHALLAQAEAAASRDQAQAEYTASQAVRYQHLFERGLVSKDQADQARSNADAGSSGVKADQAAIASARAQVAAGAAAVDTARLQLAYTVIRAPISGRTGNIGVKAGNIVIADTTELTTIAQIQPAYVTFSVPALNLSAIKRYMDAGVIAVSARPQEQEGGDAVGKLTFIDNAVDSSTDTIKLKATFPNEDRRLWPGQFARLTLTLTTVKNALVVPNEAVQTGQDGQYLFIVKPNSTVEQRPVTVGSRVDQDVVIEQGAKAGEIVVTEGQLRLEAGTHVQLRDASQTGSGGRGRGGRGGAAGQAGGRRRGGGRAD